jgi:GNAT superfamily N-acetyltransferase
MKERYGTSAQTARVDRARVHAWLSQESNWAQGRSREIQDAAIDGSRNDGVYDEDTGEQVAYARVATDRVTFAWHCDVFVAPQVRGRGVGKMLVAAVIEDLEPLGLKRTLLSTGDAHGLYAQYGFAPLADPSKMMARVR